MKILMVCLGNICRSPLAHGILDHLIDVHGLDWSVDSAGTSSFHLGHKPDPRSIEVAAQHDIDISHQRARQFKPEDFYNFDLILAMDSSNYQKILAQAPSPAFANKVEMLLNLSHPHSNRSVPDPYYEGGFEKVYEVILEACHKLVKKKLALVAT